MGVIGTIIGALLAGIIIGPLARLALPGKQAIGVPATIGAGAVGALVGGFVAQAFGIGESGGISILKFLIQVAVAAAAVVGYMKIRSKPTA